MRKSAERDAPAAAAVELIRRGTPCCYNECLAMKNWILGTSVIVVVICGFLLLEKDRQIAGARSRAEAAERQRDEAAVEAAHQGQKARQLQARLQATRPTTQKDASASETLAPRFTEATVVNREPRNPLFRDPRMRKALETEAKEGTEKNIKSLFKAGLAEQLNLDDAGSARLSALLTQKSELFWNKMLLPMMTGEISEADMGAAGEAIKTAFEENKMQLRELLGENGMSTYEWFEKTEGARDEYKDLNTRLGEAGQSLSEHQQQQLYAILTDGHANFKMHYDFDDPTQLDMQHWYNNFTEDKLEVCGQDMEALNDRMVQQAQTVLTPEQLDVFKELLAERSLKARFVVMTTTAMLAKH